MSPINNLQQKLIFINKKHLLNSSFQKNNTKESNKTWTRKYKIYMVQSTTITAVKVDAYLNRKSNSPKYWLVNFNSYRKLNKWWQHSLSENHTRRKLLKNRLSINIYSLSVWEFRLRIFVKAGKVTLDNFLIARGDPGKLG